MEAREVPGSLENIPRRSDTNVRFNDRRRIKIIGESTKSEVSNDQITILC